MLAEPPYVEALCQNTPGSGGEHHEGATSRVPGAKSPWVSNPYQRRGTEYADSHYDGSKKTEGGDQAGMGAVKGPCTIIARVPGPQTSYRAKWCSSRVGPAQK